MAKTVIRNYTKYATWTTKPPFPQTLVGYKWDPVQNKEVGPRKSLTWNAVSKAQASAEWTISDSPAFGDGPRTFLMVYNGVYAGYIIRKAFVNIAIPGTFPPVLTRPSVNPLAYPARFQFGQTGAPCGGSSCCTDTCLQMLIEYWTEKAPTLAAIRYWAQVGSTSNTAPCTGLNPTEAIRALRHYGIYHYVAAFGIDAYYVRSKAAIAPVLTGVYYGSYPNSTTHKCGWSNLAKVNGGTDCTFNGAHAVLTIATQNGGLDAVMRDPDHASPSRPEKPPYDIITLTQLNKTMKDLPTYTNWTNTFCIYSLKKKTL